MALDLTVPEWLKEYVKLWSLRLQLDEWTIDLKIGEWTGLDEKGSGVNLHIVSNGRT